MTKWDEGSRISTCRKAFCSSVFMAASTRTRQLDRSGSQDVLPSLVNALLDE